MAIHWLKSNEWLKKKRHLSKNKILLTLTALGIVTKAKSIEPVNILKDCGRLPF